VNRKITSSISWILDNLMPPILRDSRILMSMLMHPLFREKTKHFLTFKDDISISDEEQLLKYYELLGDVHIKRVTDLNQKCVNYIVDNVIGERILDIACGTGYLAKKIALLNSDKNIVGIDFNLSTKIDGKINNLELKKGSILNIAYEDKYFDTVICAHTLEHLYDPQNALYELRRVTKKRLIIILPKQREYKFTYDLHLHFYPYKYTLFSRLGIDKDALVLIMSNDYLIVENYS